MPQSQKYVPTHRAPGKHKAVRGPRRALRTGIALTGLAAAATGVSVTGGMFSSDPGLAPAAADVSPTTASAPHHLRRARLGRDRRRGDHDGARAACAAPGRLALVAP